MDGNELKIMVGEEIRRKRESQGLSLHVFADMVGTSYTHIWKVENGRVNVGLDLLCRISNALGVTPRELFVTRRAWKVEIGARDARDDQAEKAPEHAKGSRHTA